MAGSRWCQPPEQDEQHTPSSRRPGRDAGNGPCAHFRRPCRDAVLMTVGSSLHQPVVPALPLRGTRSTTGYYPWCLRHPSTFMECTPRRLRRQQGCLGKAAAGLHAVHGAAHGSDDINVLITTVQRIQKTLGCAWESLMG